MDNKFKLNDDPADTEITVSYLEKSGDISKASLENEVRSFQVNITDFNGNVLLSRQSEKGQED